MKVLMLFSISFFLFSCENDNSEDEEVYVGKWESAVYLSNNLTTGATISEQMIFTFANSTFIDKVYQSSDTTATTNAELSEAAAMKGDIESTETEFDVEVTHISVSGGAYTDKSSDPETFSTIWNASLGNILEESFTAEYVITDKVMVLTLPVKVNGATVNKTLTLYKVE